MTFSRASFSPARLFESLKGIVPIKKVSMEAAIHRLSEDEVHEVAVFRDAAQSSFIAGKHQAA